MLIRAVFDHNRGIIGVCAVLLAAGVAGQVWAASYVEITLTNTSPTDIDMFGGVLYVLDDTGLIYLYTGERRDLSATIQLNADNTSPAGIHVYDSDTIYVLDGQGMVYVYGTDPHAMPLHEENGNPVAMTGFDDAVYVADNSGELYVYTVQSDRKWAFDSTIALPVPHVSPSGIYVNNGIIHSAYVAADTVHVFPYDTKWEAPYTISYESINSLDITSMGESIYVLKDSAVYEYDISGNPVIEYDIMTPAIDPAGISVFEGLFYILDGTNVHQSGTWDIVAAVSDSSLPTGLFHDGISMYVVDDLSNAIYVNDTHTAHLHTDNAQPTGIAVHDNMAYVADSDGHVYMYNVQPSDMCAYSSAITLDDNNQSPSGVAVNNGILYIVDDLSYAIYGYTGNIWSLEGTIPLHDDNRNPTGMASYGSRLYVVDGDGTVYSYVNTIDSWIWAHDIPLHTENRDPVDISIVDGSIHVTDGVSNKLYTYDKTWDSTELYTANQTDQVSETYDIDLYFENNNPTDIRMYNGALYVLDSVDGIIYVYDQFGDKWIYSYHFSVDQYTAHPVGIAIDDGKLYVAYEDGISVYRALHGVSTDTVSADRQPTFFASDSSGGSSSSTQSSVETPRTLPSRYTIPQGWQAIVDLDQKVYTWTDRVHITIVSPDHNYDSNLIDTIGDSESDPLRISTRWHMLDRYKLVETGTDTGIFTGEVILSGFTPHDANGDGESDDARGFTGADPGRPNKDLGPTNGYIGATNDDGLSVAYQYSEYSTVVGSALIRWNIGEVQWPESSYSAAGIGVVRVIDPDMNLDPKISDNFDIKVWSDADTGGIDLTVTETGEATGIFEGIIDFTTGIESSGHCLRVAEGVTVTAKYQDHTLPDPYNTQDDIGIIATTLIDTNANPAFQVTP